MSDFCRIETPQGVVLSKRAMLARSSAQRRKGLLGRDRFDDFDGLLITPCEGVHTFGMRFPIDVIFLDRQKRVRRTYPHVKPGRVRLDLLAHSVLELPAGTIHQTAVQQGCLLQMTAS